MVGAPTRGGVPGRGGAPARETICGFWPWGAPGRLGVPAGRGVGRDGAGRGVDVEGALGAAAGLLGRGVGAVGFTIDGFAAAGFAPTADFATTAGFVGVIGFEMMAGFAAPAGFVAGVGLLTSSGADGFPTTWGLGAPGGFEGAGRLGAAAAAGRGVALGVVPVGRAGAAMGFFGVDPADEFPAGAGRAGGATAFTADGTGLLAVGCAGACGFAAATGAVTPGEAGAFLTDRIDLPGAGFAAAGLAAGAVG